MNRENKSDFIRLLKTNELLMEGVRKELILIDLLQNNLERDAFDNNDKLSLTLYNALDEQIKNIYAVEQVLHNLSCISCKLYDVLDQITNKQNSRLADLKRSK